MIIPGYRSGQTHRLVDNSGRHEYGYTRIRWGSVEVAVADLERF